MRADSKITSQKFWYRDKILGQSRCPENRQDRPVGQGPQLRPTPLSITLFIPPGSLCSPRFTLTCTSVSSSCDRTHDTPAPYCRITFVHTQYPHSRSAPLRGLGLSAHLKPTLTTSLLLSTFRRLYRHNDYESLHGREEAEEV